MARTLKISHELSYLLFNIAATRLIEARAQDGLPKHSLMQRAGLATARLTLALAPHAQHIWVACGPGNNGGDGFETALQLRKLGKTVSLTWTELGKDTDNSARQQPPDAHASRLRALSAGLLISPEPPATFEFAIDALLGIGGTLSADRPGTQLMTQWLNRMHNSGAPVLCIDLPTGLNADTGTSLFKALTTLDSPRPGARHTLSLLTLKPGLFTADGRDAAGQVWLNDLSVATPAEVSPCAQLQGESTPSTAMGLPRQQRAHASHKGSFGDVAVLGGAPGMVGAALLAARAALHAGAGRVFVALLDDAADSVLSVDTTQPELMFRRPAALDMKQQVLVCGCGGGQAVQAHLPALLADATRAVFDADALNAIAADPSLQTLLAARQSHGCATVLTPHPLEAARLLQCSTHDVQSDRRRAAQQLADRLGCVVVLKGSGSVIAAPGQLALINHSGNALLASPGTGDVLAGMIGALLAAGLPARTAAARAVFMHGRLADRWAEISATSGTPEALTASALARCASA
ncbi:MAG: NAD(P)H-hydrate dehydratase [Polaromonas sp.]|nr:NAD(P)H-hydrate dehydratase [Polaromonas sp.]